MNIAICDDKVDQIKIIKSCAEHYFSRHTECTFQIREYDNPLILLDDLSKNRGFDILLLDICMPEILGTEIVRIIRDEKEQPEIIFLTTSADFAVEAFALKAAHYIIKPFTQEQFDEAMDRALALYKRKLNISIILKLRSGESRLVDINEIVYVESFSHSQNVYLKSGECVEARQTLSELMSFLEENTNNQFISPYKGYIINQKFIKSIGSDTITLKSGKLIPIVKRSCKDIKKRYFAFMFNEECT